MPLKIKRSRNASKTTGDLDTSRRRSRLYIGAGVLVALFVAAGVFGIMRAAVLTATSERAEQRQVVVAARDIAARKPIVEEDVVMRTVAADTSNATAFTEVADVLGRVSGISILAGQIVTPNLLASQTTGQTFSIIEPGASFDPEGPDWRAVSVTVPDNLAVAGMIQPGQRVDLVVTMTINPALGIEEGDTTAAAGGTATPYVPGPSTRVTLQNMSVLARNGSVYILRADLRTAEKIGQLLAAGGQFMLVLRPDEDSRTATTDGATSDSVIDEFGFRIPVSPPVDGQPGSSAAPSATPAPSPAP